MTNNNTSYLVVRVRGISLEELMNDIEKEDNVVGIQERGDKLIVHIEYEDLEEVATLASNITYAALFLNVNTIQITHCSRGTSYDN
jgi:hypothetical protein